MRVMTNMSSTLRRFRGALRRLQVRLRVLLRMCVRLRVRLRVRLHPRPPPRPCIQRDHILMLWKGFLVSYELVPGLKCHRRNVETCVNSCFEIGQGSVVLGSLAEHLRQIRESGQSALAARCDVTVALGGRERSIEGSCTSPFL